MNESIEITFGGNLSPLASALRSMRSMVSDAGSSIKTIFAGAFTGGLAGLGAAFSLQKISESANAAMALGKHITTLSEELGVSTDFFQQWGVAAQRGGSDSERAQKGIEHLVETIGHARDGNAEAIALFRKFNVTLSDTNGTALSSQQVFEQVSKKILSIEDPAQRAGVSVDFFGKKGEELIGTLQKLDAVKADKGLILSEKDLAILDAGNVKVESLWQKVKLFSAKAWVTVLTPAVELDAMKKMIDSKGAVTAPAVTEESLAKAAAVAKAQEAVDKARLELQFATANTQGKYLESLIKVGDAQAKLNGLQAGTVEYLQAQKELIDVQRESLQAKAALDKESQDKQKQADKDHKDKLKGQQDIIKDLRDKNLELAKLGRERTREQTAEYMPTLEQLANTGRTFFAGNHWQFQQGPFAGIARELMRLQADAPAALAWGNRDRFQADINRIEELKKGLRDAHVMAPDDKLTSIDANMSKTQADINSLLTKATQEGINVKGRQQ